MHYYYYYYVYSHVGTTHFEYKSDETSNDDLNAPLAKICAIEK